MVIALAFLMPVTGALFAVVLITIFAVRLTLGEEAFLTSQTRRALPGLSARGASLFSSPSRQRQYLAGAKPHWLRASLTELTPIGIFVAIVVFSKNYDLELAGRIILIFFGASLVVRAIMPGVLGQIRARKISPRLPSRPRCVQPKPSEYLSP